MPEQDREEAEPREPMTLEERLEELEARVAALEMDAADRRARGGMDEGIPWKEPKTKDGARRLSDEEGECQ